VPLVEKRNAQVLRSYYTARDKQNRSRPSYFEVRADNPSEILYVHDKPILELGLPGTFDDSGVMCSDVISVHGKIYFYYVGWNIGTTARYRTALGLAVSDDNGKNFHKVSDGPVMDRNPIDPISTSCQSVINEAGILKTWYMSYLKWENLNGQMEPFYQIKYAESKDGLNWQRENKICIPLHETEGGIACPSVLKESGLYRMWYSVRLSGNYRMDKKQSYRIGYAESDNGIDWIRKDNEAGIDVSEQGWDSDMIAYPYVIKIENKYLMFYK
jgi:predicted GH43/DUF377 family glycosyl hydrolase